MTPDPVIWYCQGVGYLATLMMSWMLLSKNELNVSHSKQVNDTSNMRLVTSLMNFECQPCGIVEGLEHHQ